MDERKIEIVNGASKREEYEKKQDVWSRLRGDDFSPLDSAKARNLLNLCVAEMLGTATFVGLGCSSLIGNIEGTESHLSHLNIALTFACGIALVVMVFGHVSGCHVNPAVSLSAVIFGNLSLPRFFLYVISQCLGATLGTAAVKIISPWYCTEGSFCVTTPTPAVGTSAALLAEAMCTGILVWAVNAAWDPRCQDKHDSLPVKFGLVIIALVLPGAKYSGGSMNPARSFGPALLAGNFTDHWVYWVGPLTGSTIASLIYKTFLSEVKPKVTPTSLEVTEEMQPL
ncbi:aquaporin AQPAn.G-like [Macrosteles quadrilineatus]|uniref:aquaporin AQPAn.G-like n=1 Tax=Macrosteles quadrilineatus TaxID=74068 RepID=UPI0023E1D381|nr:aquaporin AQPAn.G-like [Macrosteles quadrilineatus]